MNSTRTAFIALDYIIDIMHPDGKVARSAKHATERDVITKVNRALCIADSKKWLSILVKVGFDPLYLTQPKHSPLFGRVHELGALNQNEYGTQFHPDLQVKPNYLVITKPRISAFYATTLEAILRANKIERVVIAGVSTSWAVQSTARDAHDRDYQVVIVEDACAALDHAEHLASIQLLSTIAQITTTEKLHQC